MKNIIKLLLANVLFTGTSHLLFANVNQSTTINGFNNLSDTTFKVFSVSKGGYGFDIKVGDKILIHQPFIPALEGNNGFAKKSDAEKVATLMIRKLREHGMPPTITTEEIDSLHIIHRYNNIRHD